MNENPYQSPEADGGAEATARNAAWRGARLGTATGGGFGGVFLTVLMAYTLVDIPSGRPLPPILGGFAVGLVVTITVCGLLGSMVGAVGFWAAAVFRQRRNLESRFSLTPTPDGTTTSRRVVT